MSLKLAVFDVDGTLVDSRGPILQALNEGAKAVGLEPPPYEEARHIVGLSLVEALQHLRPEADAALIDAYAHEYKQAFLRFHADPDFREILYPGAEATLLRLKAEGWLIGMATGKSRRGVNRVLDVFGWRDLFDATYCGDDGPSKPHPFMVTENMRVLGVDASQTLMIGDASFDMRMAIDARAYAIGVSWGFHTVEELDAAGAHQIVHDFNELDGALNAFEARAVA
ncbi:HAD-IA family hydrolase [Asticcacaulis sp. ZE23SCel15]|uniref:HAD-IA family hydrolase n=1 Tax=Asticcacaulis sp. ZE23SCel15 TaxID=3059027 RepID=UPI00265FAB76|nr:HAD-IA family hydrolase [Asticcacaulis sp. ZE23SCel15]WKL57306.1 HAD-IA family hydrolase [Asticcacaulis sp. ZE23SCel15]